MTDEKIILITDPELGELDHSDTDEVVKVIDTLPQPPAKPTEVPNIGQEDIEEYKKAWAEADVDTLELLRAKHPEDARFNLHLSLIELSQDEEQDFSEVNDNHKELIKDLGLSGAPEFLRLLEEGNKGKLKRHVASLPNSDPLKKSMELLLTYI